MADPLPITPAVTRMYERCRELGIAGAIEVELILAVDVAIELDRINSTDGETGASPLYSQMRHLLDRIRNHMDLAAKAGGEKSAYEQFLDDVRGG
ncbi:MAG: hypothetical protein OXH64_12085 [Rhodospirillaceae bacterium]|nr:hypothetical protein [Rhodospirillaceae bacterium]